MLGTGTCARPDWLVRHPSPLSVKAVTMASFFHTLWSHVVVSFFNPPLFRIMPCQYPCPKGLIEAPKGSIMLGDSDGGSDNVIIRLNQNTVSDVHRVEKKHRLRWTMNGQICPQGTITVFENWENDNRSHHRKKSQQPESGTCRELPSNNLREQRS